MKHPALRYTALFFSLTAATLLFCYQMGYFAETESERERDPKDTFSDSVLREAETGKDRVRQQVSSEEQPAVMHPQVIQLKEKQNKDIARKIENEPYTAPPLRMFSSKSMIFPPGHIFEPSPTIQPEIIIEPVDSAKETLNNQESSLKPPKDIFRMPSSKVMIMPERSALENKELKEIVNPKVDQSAPSIGPKPKKPTGQRPSPFNKSQK